MSETTLSLLDPTASDAWFVYLLRSSDCTAFKVGFTCNPLQRFYSFHRRYFEGFDLPQSMLLRLESEQDARRAEALVKASLAAHRHDAPTWVAEAAGGYTEWFAALHADTAEAQLRAQGQPVLNAAESIHEHIRSYAGAFEHWASMQASVIVDPRSFGMTALAAREAASVLRDWLDAYRYFQIDLFVDEPDTFELVSRCAQAY